MPWKVKATARKAGGHKVTRTVARFDEFDDELIRVASYWIRNMEPGEKVVIERFTPGMTG